jgi:RNase H-fold protein (predicted Holliday junction resolvase)
MENTSMTILAISIGTLRTGVCVLEGHEILDRQMHSYPNEWSATKLQIIIQRYREYIVEYNVNAIIVKIPPLASYNQSIRQIIRQIIKLAKKYHCEYDFITKSEMKHITQLKHTSSLIEYVLILHPELSPLYMKGINTGHRDYKKLYEAVLSAHIYQERLKNRIVY